MTSLTSEKDSLTSTMAQLKDKFHSIQATRKQVSDD